LEIASGSEIWDPARIAPPLQTIAVRLCS
jgi:hypothetical protein